MNSRGVAPTLFAAAILATTVDGCTTTTPPSPAEEATITTGRTFVLSTTPWATQTAFVGRAQPDQRMDLNLYLQLRERQTAASQALTKNDPAEKDYGTYLTAEEFRGQFSPSEASFEKVRAWLESTGMVFDYAPKNRLYLSAHGPVASVEKAFQTEIGRFSVTGRELRAPLTPPSVPNEFAGSFTAVIGLHDAASSMQPLRSLRPTQASGSTSSSGTTCNKNGICYAPPPPGFIDVPNTCSAYFGSKTTSKVPPFGPTDPSEYIQCPFTPPTLRTAYGVPGILSQGINGTGVTVAVVEAFAAAKTLSSDVAEYANTYDPGHPYGPSQLTEVVAPGCDPKTPPQASDIQAAYGEETFDIEAIHAFAPGAAILYVGTKTEPNTNPSVEALNYIVDNELATIVSNSYADPEAQPEDFAAFETIAIQGDLEGIGMYFGSGDDGDYSTCGPATSSFPASLPQVTAVGGTSLAVDKSGARLFEVAWAETGSTLVPGSTLKDGSWSPAFPGSFVLGSGGGPSALYAQPSYQKGIVPPSFAKVNGTLWRVTPDVALVADAPGSTFLEGETQTFPDGVYFAVAGYGGTSLSTPLMAALAALAQQAHGKTIGFINPVVYENRATLMTDIVPAAGLPTNVYAFYNDGTDNDQGTTFYSETFDVEVEGLRSAVGYDDITGLGVPNVAAFVDYFKSH